MSCPDPHVKDQEADPKDQLLCRLELQQTIHLARIRDLEKACAALETSQSGFATLYEQSPIAYVTLDSKGRIHNANTAALALLESGRSRLLNLPFSLLVHAEDRPCLGEHLARCAGGSTAPVTTELRLRTSHQNILPAQLIGTRFGTFGQRLLFLTAIVDVTGRHRDQLELIKAKEFAETIIETVGPLAVLDSDLRIVSVNRAFTELFNRPAKHIRGVVFDAVLHLWWSGNQLRDRLEKVLVKNQPMERFLIAVVLPGVGRRILHLNARRLRQDREAADRIVVVLEDISEREDTREQLRKTNAELEQRISARTDALQKSYEQMEAFCYSIAHDLRAPLRSISGFSHLLLDELGPEISSAVRSYATRIKGSAEHMDVLIQSLLQYGRLNTIDLPVLEVNTEQIFENVIRLLDGEIAERQARVRKKHPLPRLFGHPLALQIALANLISNALKFVAPGVRPEVTIWSEERRNWVRIWVADNGIGIAPENHKKIFGVFQRLHSDKCYAGTGIGLALVNKGIERIGGRVGLESEPGCGSRFWIELKRTHAPQFSQAVTSGMIAKQISGRRQNAHQPEARNG
ncbi:MAG TPA: ATP-binding protein [Verrucomicrobiae bacterium]|nr:ATP-binding protein [Verrucomicrobiae bacterium]